MNAPLLLLITLTFIFLGGCELPHVESTGSEEPVSKILHTMGSPKKEIANPYLKPDFRPMNFEQYKAEFPNLAGLDCGIDDFFDTYINVFGVTVAAMPNTPVPEVIHAAKIYAKLMDNDEDFTPDDPRIFDYHQQDLEGRNHLIVLVDTKAMDNAWIAFRPGQRFWVPAQALRPGHSGVGHSRDGEMDIAVEELFHKYGKAFQRVYPKDFGLPDYEAHDTWSSTLSNAMDQARGIDRTVRPINGKWTYPENAWYTYDDTSCGWGCQIDEYFWHIWATNIGYYEMLTRPPGTPKENSELGGWCNNLHSEWKPCSKQDLKLMDSKAYLLINNKDYQLPTRIPFGEYGGNRVTYHGYEISVDLENGLRFMVNRGFAPKLSLKRGNTYFLDQSLEGNSGFPLRFSSSANGVHQGGEEYLEGVVINGIPGNRGSYVRITVAETAPDQLYLYCPEQKGMATDNFLMIED